ncbi:MAG: alanine--tRNA ligase [Candidatus Paceibacterota bacterium]
MTSNEIRQKFLKFFENRGHKIISSASLIPENDPSVLFTTAGMHPLVPYLLGEKHPEGKKLTNVQKCIRTGDIEEVGDYSHHTFFEMLGNWSLGDYFKKEAIELSYEFLTSKEYLGLNKERLAVSVFAGDDDAPFDEEAYNTWKGLGIDEKRIAKLPKKNNWWGPAGETGPCGPDSEMFYWVGEMNEIPKTFNDDHPLWLEIWNDVFMQYNKTIEKNFESLAQRNIDTGMGLERITAVVNGLDDNYRTELFWPMIKKIEELSGLLYGDKNDRECIKENGECWVDTRKSFRIIADHIKASIFILGDEKGIAPSNGGQGYVLRRLIRIAIRHGRKLGLQSFIKELTIIVIDMYKDIYPEILANKDFIIDNLLKEEEKFRQTLEQGLKEFEKGVDPFDLYQSFGFPIELTEELAFEKGIKIDRKDFNKKLKQHQDLSRTSSAGMFKGGLADSGEESTKYHTATHLLLAALRQVLGEDIVQKGSNITAERMRFDFNWPEKLSDLKLKEIEDLVNKKIGENIPVEMLELPKEEAVKIVKNLSFDLSKYGDIVKVYKIGDFSAEFCGGPHVENTGLLGHFKIQKEEASSAGVRRIKAVLE